MVCKLLLALVVFAVVGVHSSWAQCPAPGAGIDQQIQGLDSRLQVLEAPAGPVAFHAFVANTHTLANDAPLVFDTVTLNIGSDYDGVSGEFTCEVAGIYSFAVTVLSDWSANLAVETSIYKQNAGDPASSANVVGRTYSGTGGDVHGSGSNVVLLQLQAGDKVYVRKSFGDDTIWYLWTTFSGHLIR